VESNTAGARKEFARFLHPRTKPSERSIMKSPMNTLSLFAWIALLSLGFSAARAQNAPNAPESMRFFVTSAGSGTGGDLGGLTGADAHCQSLAAAVGARARTWTEKGAVVNGRGDTPNMHDILTGSQPDGKAFPPDKDMTCKNWTSSTGGAAMIWHIDRTGLTDDPPGRSWNSSHQSRDCSQDGLKSTGGVGLFYCFAIN
jgi:hypothetical protein